MESQSASPGSGSLLWPWARKRMRRPRATSGETSISCIRVYASSRDCRTEIHTVNRLTPRPTTARNSATRSVLRASQSSIRRIPPSRGVAPPYGRRGMSASASETSGRIFISYRRQDSAYPAGWLYDRLADRFGADQIFKDVDSIELGDDFVET